MTNRFVSAKPQKIMLDDNDFIEVKSLPYDQYQELYADFDENDKKKAMELSMKLLTITVVAWNFKDENDQLVACTPENIRQLDIKTITEISAKIQPFLFPEKKN